QGGIRVPCFVRWPGKIKPGTKVDRVAAHIDLTPTLLAACDVEKPAETKFDGKNVLPLLTGSASDWPDRALYFQWHRGDVPEMGRACAARSQRWKLAQPTPPGKVEPRWLLFDLDADPAEANDLAAKHPEIVERMKSSYEAWFKDVSATR